MKKVELINKITNDVYASVELVNYSDYATIDFWLDFGRAGYICRNAIEALAYLKTSKLLDSKMFNEYKKAFINSLEESLYNYIYTLLDFNYYHYLEMLEEYFNDDKLFETYDISILNDNIIMCIIKQLKNKIDFNDITYENLLDTIDDIQYFVYDLSFECIINDVQNQINEQTNEQNE